MPSSPPAPSAGTPADPILGWFNLFGCTACVEQGEDCGCGSLGDLLTALDAHAATQVRAAVQAERERWHATIKAAWQRGLRLNPICLKHGHVFTDMEADTGGTERLCGRCCCTPESAEAFAAAAPETPEDSHA